MSSDRCDVLIAGYPEQGLFRMPVMNDHDDRVEKFSVFIVDDDPAVRNSLQFALELEGYAVRTFADADQLLGRVDDERPSCLIVDYALPGPNGLELLGALRQRQIAAPAILITSHPNRGLRQLAAQAGVPIVEKPLLTDTLTDEIRALCGSHS